MSRFAASHLRPIGTWGGGLPGRTPSADNGTFERTFVFKVDGSKLTGETAGSFLGKSVINDGKVDGDNLSFTISVNFQGNDTKVSYNGKVSGNDIKMTSDFHSPERRKPAKSTLMCRAPNAVRQGQICIFWTLGDPIRPKNATVLR